MSGESNLFDSFVNAANRHVDTKMGMADELTIRGLLLMLKRRRSIVFWTMAISFIMAAIMCAFIKPRYKALGEIQVQKTSTDGLGLDNLTGPRPVPSDSLEENIDLQTQATILQSYSLSLKVIDDLKLENTEDFQSTFSPTTWVLDLLTPGTREDPPNASLDDAPRRRDAAVKRFQRHLKIKPQAGTQLIDITYTSTDPQIAAAVVNDLTKSLVDYALTSRVTATSQVSEWLAGQMGEIKKEAEDQQGKLERLQRESGVYSLGIPDASGKEIAYSATLDRLQQATQELSTATSNRIVKGALFKTIENGDPELISGLAGSSLAGSSPAVNNSFLLIQNLRNQQASLASQFASDASKYGSANPKLVDDKASLDSINAQISSEVSRIGQRVANDYKAAQATEETTRSVYEQLRKSADNLNDKAIALLIARQEATDARNLYQTLNSHLKEAGVIEGLRSSNVAIVDIGRRPALPVPWVLIIPAASLFVGFFLGVAFAFLVESTSDRIQGMAAIENLLGVPILAILPLIQSRQGSHLLGGFASQIRKRLGNGNDDSKVGRVAVLDGPNTAFVEAIRGLRTSLLIPPNGKTPKSILITSASEQEGKSTLSLNLAAALVLNGSSVLLVDADMRSAGLSAYIGYGRKTTPRVVDNETSGISDALSGSREPAILTPFSDLPRLSAVSAGSRPKYPAELLGSGQMRKMLQTWSANYDYVVIDSPPVLAVSDAVILSRLVDTTLLVARHGCSTQKSLERAYRTLNNTNGKEVGIVVNGVRRDSVSFDEFYGYNGTVYYSEV